MTLADIAALGYAVVHFAIASVAWVVNFLAH